MNHLPLLTRSLAALLLVAMILTPPAGAATLIWDTATGDGATITGGTGTWTNGAGNWNNGTTNVNWTNATPDSATFGGTAGTVTLGGGVTVGNMTFNVGTGNYTIAGGGNTLTLSTSTITTNTTSTISANLGGGTGLTKAGTDSLILTGNNTYTGVTNVNAGSLRVGSANALGATGDGTVVANNASLQILGGVTTAAEPVTINGTFSNFGALRGISNTTADYTGLLTLGSTSRINSDQAGTLILSNTGTITGAGFGLIVGGTGTTVISSIIGTGTGTLTKDGAGTLTVTGANTYTGATTVSAGTLNLSGAGNANNSDIAISGSSNLTFTATDSRSFTKAITGTAGNISFNVAGNTSDSGGGDATSFSMSNTGAFTGTVVVNTGLVSASSSAAFGNTANVIQLNAASGQSAGLMGNGLTLASTRAIQLTQAGGNSVFRAFGGSTFQIDGQISGAGNLVKTDGGTLTLTGANTYTGTTRVGGGVLQVNNALALQNSALDTAGSGVVTLSSVTTPTLGGLTGSSNLASVITTGYSGVTSLTLNPGTGAANTYSGVVANGAAGMALVKTGAGTQTLSGANTYSGATTVSAGALNIQNANALGTTAGATSVTSGAALQIQGGITTAAEALTLNGTGVSTDGALRNISGTNTYAGPVTLGAASRINSDAGTLTLSHAGTITGSGLGLTVGGAGNTTIASIIGTGTGTLTKDGAGTLTLSGINTFSGNVTVSAGTLEIAGAGEILRFANTSTVTIASGATALLSGTTGNALGHGHGSAEQWVVAGTINSTGGAEQSFPVGGVTLNGGTLTGVASGGSFGTYYANGSQGAITANGTGNTLSAADVGINSGATLTLATPLAGDTLTASAVFKNRISAGNLTKTGSGTVTLTGANTYTGATTISAGTLQVGNGSTTGALSTSSAITNNGTLSFNRSNTITQGTDFNSVVSGTGALTQAGSGTLVLNGVNTYSGATTVSAGVLNIQNANALGTTAAGTSVTSGAALQIQGGITTAAEALTLNGTGVSTDGALRNISGTNTYAGLVALGAASRINSDAGTLTLSNAGTITGAGLGLTVGGAGNTTIASIIGTGTGTLTKDGAGTLTLSGANTYTGATTVSAGTLQIGNGTTGSISSSSAVSTAAGATLSISLANNTTLANNITNTGNVTFLDNGTTNSYNGVISGTGSVTQAGTGITAVGTNQTYTGETTISAGKLQIGTGGTTGALSASSAITNNGTLQFFRSNTVTQGTDFASVISGTGALQKTGVGTLVLNGANTYTGTTTITTGTLQIGDGGITGGLSASSAITNNATLSFNRSNTVTQGTDFASVISGSGAVTQAGSGTLVLSGTNTYGGATTISAGTLQIGDGGTTGALSTSSSITNNATLVFNRSNTITQGTNFNSVISGTGALTQAGSGTLVLSGTNTYTGATTISAGTLQIGGGSTTGALSTSSSITNNATLAFNRSNTMTQGTDFNSVISGTGALTQSGSGTLVLNGTNTYTGATTVSTGVLNIQNANALGTTAGATSVTSGAALQIQGSITTDTEALTLNGTGVSSDGALRNISGTNSYAGLVTLGAATRINSDAGTLTLSNAGTITGAGLGLTVGGAGNTTIASIIGTTSGTLSKDGAGTLTLSGANTFTGATTVSAGALNIQNANALGTTAGATSVTSGAALQIQGSITTDTEALTLNGTGLSSDGALRNISGTNSYAGLVTLGAATRINSDAGTLTLSNAGTITGATFGLTVGGAGNTTIASIIGTTSGTMTKDGAGTLSLSGANTYTGATTVSAGALNIQNANALGTTAAGTSVTSGAALQIQGNITTAAEALTLNGTGVSTDGALRNISGTNTYAGLVALGAASRINSDAGTLTLSNAGTITGAGLGLTVGGAGNTTIASIIGTTTGTLTKDGAGTLTLSGANTFTGATTISAGTLQIGNGGTTGALATSSAITNNATLAFNRSNTTTQGSDFNSVISGTGALTQAGSGTLVITGANTYTGATTVNAGTLQIGNGGTTGVLATSSAITNNATLAFNRSNSTTQGTDFGSVISGTGAVTQSGTGTLVLSGTNTYTGATTVSSGILNVQNATGLGTTAGSTTVSNGATLQLQGGITVGAEALSLNGGAASGQTGALVNVSGTNTYGGAVTVTASSSISAASGSVLNLTGGVVKNGTVATFNGGGTINVNTVAISGASANSDLVIDGTTVNVDVASTYNGPTFIRNSGTLNANVTDALPTANGRTAVTFDGTGTSVLTLGAAQSVASLTAASAATVTLGANALTVGTSTGSTSFAGIIGGTGGLTKDGASTQVLTGANTFTGATTVSEGVLNMQNANALGTTAAGTSVTSGAALQIQGGITTDSEALTLNGTGVSTDGALRNISGTNSYAGLVTLGAATRINSDAGTLTLSNTGTITGAGYGLSVGGAGDTTIASIIGTGTGTLTKDGAGTLTLSGANTYSGDTTINAGTVALGSQANQALGTGTVVVNSGGTLHTDRNTLTNSVTLNGGTLLESNGFGSTFSGAVDLAATSTVTTPYSMKLLNTASGAGGLIKNGNGTVTLSGANTYTGTTTISAGTLQIGDGGTTGALATSSAITNNATLSFNRSNTITQGTDFNSVISGTGAVTQAGSGTLVLSGTNTYTGATTVSAGTLSVTGSIGSSSLTTINGGTLMGTGTVGAIQLNSAGAVNVGAGTLSTGNIAITDGQLVFSIGGTGSYGQLSTSGTVNLTNGGSGAQLVVNAISGYTAHLGDTFTLITNDLTDAISGNFAGLTEGQKIPNFLGSSLAGQITYVGGTGNDVVLMVVSQGPTVTSLTPSSGSTAGGTSVTITGTDFTGATGVTIGGAAATSVTVVNSTTITAVTPAGTAGTASVVVTTADGSNTANTLYTFANTAPTLAAVSKSGFEDTTVTFTAANFTSAFTDPESDSLASITVATLPATGTLKLSGTNVTASQVITAANLANLTYVPAFNESGAKTFTVTASDGSLSSAAATVTMTLTAVNDAPSFAMSSAPAPAALFSAENNANDSSGNGNNGAAVNGVTYTAGAAGNGQAFRMNGTNQYASVPHSSSLSFASSLTISAWVRMTDRNTHYFIAAKQPSLGANSSWPGNYELRINPSGNLEFMFQNVDTDIEYFISTSSVPLNTWTQVVVVFTAGSSVNFYINGAAAGTTSTSVNSLLTNTQPLLLGTRDDRYSYFAGDMDEVYLVGSALSASQVALLYASQFTVAEDSGAYSQSVATSISAGPADESAQTVSFTVTNTNNALFSVQPAMDASGTLTFTSAANAYGSATVSVTAVDNGGTANSGVDTSAAQTFALTVTAVNDTPTDIALSTATIAENNAANATVGTLSTTDVDAGDTFTYTLVSGTGSTDNGSFTISGTSLKLTPSADYESKSSYAVRVRTTDAGGLYYEEALTINISDVNEAPAISATIAIGSNQLIYETVNPTRSGSDIVYSVNNASAFAGASFSRVRYRMELTVSGTPRYAETTFDAWGGLTVADLKVPDGSTPITIQRNVTNMTVDSNYPGVFNGTAQTGRLEIWPSNYGRGANGGVGGDGNTYDFDDSGFDTGPGYGSFQVHNLSAGPPQTVFAWNQHGSTSPDIGFGNQPTGEPDWTFSNGSLGKTDWKLQISISAPYTFALTEDVTGNLLFTGTPFTDDSASLTVTLGVDDGTITGNAGTGITVGGTAVSRTFTGTVADLNTYFTTAGKITYLGVLNNNSARTLAISISDGAFTTNGSGTITLAPVNDTPTDIALSAATIAENNAANATVGTLSTTDVDTSDTFTYTLVSGTGSTDNANFTIAGTALKLTPSADFETKSSYAVRVRTTDAGGLFFEKAFTISITDVNETPVITSNGGVATASISVAENTTTVTTVTATDPEVPSLQTLTYSKTGADAALFTISSSTGVITFTSAPNYELPLDAGADNVYDVTVTASDNGSPLISASQHLSIAVTDVVEVQRDVSNPWTQSYGGVDALTTRRSGDAKAVVVQQSAGSAVAAFATGFTTNAAGNKDIYTVCYNPATGAVVWEKIFNGTASGHDEGSALAVDGNGDLIVTGYSTNASGNADVLTVKYAHSDGTQLWQKIYAGSGNGADVGTSVAVDASNNVAVAGCGTRTATGLDVFGARYASDGSTLFEVLVDGGSSSTDLATSVAIDSAGNLLAAGYATKSGSAKDLLVVKLSAAAGTSLWTWTANGSSNAGDQAYAVAVGAADAVFVTGSVRNSNDDIYLAKLSSAGTAQWSQQWNSPANSSDASFAVTLDGQGNLILAGHSYKSAGVQDGYLAKYNSATGALQWDYRFDGPASGNDILRSVGVDKENNLIATGYSQNASGTYDMVILKLLGADGGLLWTQRYNGSGNLNDEGRAVVVTDDGQAFVAGYATSTGGTTDFLVTSYSPAVPGTQTAQTITFANPGAQNAGTPLALSASSSSGLTVRFTVVSGSATFDGTSNTLLNFTGSGSVTVRASQSGSAVYAAAAPVDQTFTVSKSSQTISFLLPASLNSTAQWPLTGVASSGLAVTYNVQSGPGSITGGVLSFSGAGDVTVRASQAGDGRFNAASNVDAVVTSQNHTPVVIFDNIAENWRDTYAGSGAGAGSDIALQLSGNDAVAGFVAGYTTTASTGKDLYLVKYLADGTLVWSVASGTAGDDEALSAVVDGNGDVVVAGYVTGTGRDLYVAKYNGSTGSKVWDYTYSGTGSGNDVGVSLALDGTTNVVVGGYAVGSGTSNDFFAAKLNLTSGALVWASVRNRTGATSDVPAKVAVGTDGSVALAGATNSDAWTVKLAAADGTLVWQIVYNFLNKPDAVRGLALDAANNVIIAAYSQGSNYDIYTAKYASLDGTLIWGKRYNSSFNSSDHPWDLAVDEDSNVYVTGASYRAASIRDGMTLKYAGLDGTLMWEGRYNGTSSANDENFTIALDGIGNPVISGYTTNSDGTTDVYLAKHSRVPGTIRWQNTFDGANNKNDSIQKVKVDPNGNVWMAGSATGADGKLVILVLRNMPTP